MAEVRMLGPSKRVPQNATHVVVVQENSQSGGQPVYTVTATLIGKLGGPMPSGQPFRDANAAIAEAQQFASAHNLPVVYFRPATP